MAKKAKANQNEQRALVVGVSNYPSPISKLPGVSADVREMAKLLGSRNGRFKRQGVSVLTDKQATRQQILDGLEKTFAGSSADETVFAYLAGHGTVEGNEYFFIAYDTDVANLATTGVPLTKIKSLFDRTASRRVFLWLDFCHSGGILARRMQVDDMPMIRRALEVIKGEGKVIVAACTPSQLAYEDPAIGHGLFTHALLRGLKGDAKSAQGEVTALSLYEFIDHQVANGRQQPVFFGEMTGRIVLMHYADRSSDSSVKVPAGKKKAIAPSSNAGMWIMLGDDFFPTNSVRWSDGKVDVRICPDGGEQEATLASLRPIDYLGRTSLPFAVNNEAHIARVERVHTETINGKQIWTLSLSTEPASAEGWTEMTVNGIGPDEIARRRAGRILLNDPPPIVGSQRGYNNDSMLDGIIEGSSSRYPIRECVIRSVYQQHAQSSNWKEFARLKAVFLLRVSGTVEHILELTLGAIRKNSVAVTFRGRRPRRGGIVAPEMIKINGSCPLG